MKKYNEVILEAVTWASIIIFTLVTVLVFSWETAQPLLNNIAFVTGGATVFWYLKSRRLFLESDQKTKKLAAKQHELLNKDRTFDLVFQNSADGFLFLDSEQRITGFSPGMEKITGFTAENMTGRQIKDVLQFKGDTENSLLPDVMFLPDSLRKKPHVSNTLQTKDGRIIDIEASCTLIHGLGKGKDQALAIVRDMTYANELARRDKEFIAVTSHQLNTPLSIIQGYLALLKNGRAGEINQKQNEYLETILLAVKKMIALTNSMLTISRIEQEKITLIKSDVNVNKLLEQLHQNLRSVAEEKKIDFLFDCPQSNVILYADQDKLYQALSNLVDNAIKYTSEGSVKISIKNENGKIIFVVADTGIGISPDEIKKIGEKFYRTQKAIDIDNKGTGLGVFIAKTIIEKHGGEMKIKSEPGKGSTFEFFIPNNA